MKRIGLPPIVINCKVKDITTALQDFKSSFDKNRSEQKLFDEAVKTSVNYDIIDIHDITMTKTNQTYELQHTIRGLKTTPATIEQPALAGIAEAAAFIGGIDTITRTRIKENRAIGRQKFSRTYSTNRLTDPFQVQTTSSQLLTTIERNNPTESARGRF